MKVIIVLLVIACLAYTQGIGLQRGGMDMEQASVRIQLDDIKYLYHNLPAETKNRLFSILRFFGLSSDDVEQALENPPEEVKQMFGPSGMSIDDMRSAVNNLPEPLKRML
ncbi:hypothetical protein CHS0354_037535 [Potamilus streckersoni]|uniref:Uncharacterized protein n=1 Tax=Potamilus streckersoni TaxID=2493646 RepID=A0AAE0S6I2_9BIVA|nr:hypothetical protein CHS0354_037535 [Potamilus streckersoni]